MDFNLIMAVSLGVVIAYLAVKFIVSPLLKIVFGIAMFLTAIFILQKFFNFDFGQTFGSFDSYFDISKWTSLLNPILLPVKSFIDQGLNLFSFLKKTI